MYQHINLNASYVSFNLWKLQKSNEVGVYMLPGNPVRFHHVFKLNEQHKLR